MKAKLLVAALAVVLFASQAKAVTYTISATLMGGFGPLDTQLIQWTSQKFEIENGQIVAFFFFPTITQGQGADPNTWHVNASDTIHQSPFNQTITNCPLGCYIDMLFATPSNGTLDGYVGGTILSLTFFSSDQACPLGECRPIGSARYDMIAGTGSISLVPIPGALPLFATGLGLLGWLGWRRRRA